VRYLLDTNIISYLVRDPRGPIASRAAALPSEEIGTSVIVVGEIRFGFARQPSPKLEQQTATILRGLTIEELDASAAEAYGQVRADLQRRGEPIGNNDMWIAAHALALDCTLVSANEREFRRVSRLKVENWAP
jgi:tRNA(fMet)-specific endonuclease VapC